MFSAMIYLPQLCIPNGGKREVSIFAISSNQPPKFDPSFIEAVWVEAQYPCGFANAMYFLPNSVFNIIYHVSLATLSALQMELVCANIKFASCHF